MIYKYFFSVSGDNLYPEQILDKIQGDFIVDSYYSPTDKKFDNNSDDYQYGGISFWHPNKFSIEDNVVEYERCFIEFIEKNYLLFTKNGADEFQIFIEIYYSGDQCNFEIFNKFLLKKLSIFEVSIPISVFILAEEELQEWENEIKLIWEI